MGSDNFNRASLLTGGPTWSTVGAATDWGITSNELDGPTGVGTLYTTTGISSVDDQYIAATVVVRSGTPQLAICITESDGSEMYFAQINASSVTINKLVGGTATQLATRNSTHAVGDRYLIRTRGDYVILEKNGAVMTSILDTAISRGSGHRAAGFRAGGTSPNLRWDDAEWGEATSKAILKPFVAGVGGPTTSTNGATSVNVARPKYNTGDLLLMFFVHDAGAVTTPSTYTLIANDTTQATIKVSLFGKIATDTQTSTGTVTVTQAAGIGRGAIVAIRDAAGFPDAAHYEIVSQSTASTTMTGGPVDVETLLLWAVFGAPSQTNTSEAINTGTWYFSESFDSTAGGVNSFMLSYGDVLPAASGITLSSTLSASKAYATIAVAPVKAPPLKLNGTVSALKLGATSVDAAYLGSTLIWT